MTEGIGSVQSQDTSSIPVTAVSSPSTPPVESSERTFRQSEVSDIVKRAKQDAVDTYKRMQTEQPQYLAQKYGQDAITQPNTYQQQQGLREDDYRKIAAEEAQRLRDEWMQSSQLEAQKADAQRIVSEFWNKVAPGKDKYSDYEQVVGDIEFGRFPNVVQLLAQHVDNADSVLYELGKDRIRMGNLEYLANVSPRDAIAAAKRLADSIKANQEAANIKTPNAPLSQMRPSNAGTDTGAMSVKDYRRKYKV